MRQKILIQENIKRVLKEAYDCAKFEFPEIPVTFDLNFLLQAPQPAKDNNAQGIYIWFYDSTPFYVGKTVDQYRFKRRLIKEISTKNTGIGKAVSFLYRKSPEDFRDHVHVNCYSLHATNASDFLNFAEMLTILVLRNKFYLINSFFTRKKDAGIEIEADLQFELFPDLQLQRFKPQLSEPSYLEGWRNTKLEAPKELLDLCARYPTIKEEKLETLKIAGCLNLSNYSPVENTTTKDVSMYLQSLFDESIQEATDKVYIGKVGNKYLKGHSLVKSAAQADVFESETEPKQRLNQMKKDAIIPKKTKVKILSKKDENLKESMKFVMERSTEPFKIREGSEYEVLYDENIDKYGLLVDGTLFCFLTPSQAKTLSENIKNKEVFEKFFNSVGIGDEWLNLQPKAACDPNYKRPTGDI